MNQTPKIVTLENKKLVGQAMEMSLIENKTVQLFTSFMPNKKTIKNRIDTPIYEVLIYKTEHFKNFNPANKFTKWAAVEVTAYDNIPENMKALDLNTGLYAVFNYKGLAQNFGVFMGSIFTNWLPKSRYQLDNRPHFNVLGNKYKHNSPESEEEVWVPIKIY